MYRAYLECLQSVSSETSVSRPLKGWRYLSSHACTPTQLSVRDCCQAAHSSPVRAALCSFSKTIYALTFSWCLLGSRMIWGRKFSSSCILQPVADTYSPAPALSFISWLFPKALIQTAALFSRHFSRV